MNSQLQSSNVGTHDRQGSVEFVERRVAKPEAKVMAKRQKSVGQQRRLPESRKAAVAQYEATIEKKPT